MAKQTRNLCDYNEKEFADYKSTVAPHVMTPSAFKAAMKAFKLRNNLV